jgi:predicted HD phosphohydrolase
MNDDEVAEFEKNPHLHDIVQLRYWDDQGKVPNHITPDFAHYAPMLQRVVDRYST